MNDSASNTKNWQTHAKRRAGKQVSSRLRLVVEDSQHRILQDAQKPQNKGQNKKLRAWTGKQRASSWLWLRI